MGGVNKGQEARSDYWDRAMRQARRIGKSSRKGQSVSAWARSVKKALGK